MEAIAISLEAIATSNKKLRTEQRASLRTEQAATIAPGIATRNKEKLVARMGSFGKLLDLDGRMRRAVGRRRRCRVGRSVRHEGLAVRGQRRRARHSDRAKNEDEESKRFVILIDAVRGDMLLVENN